MIKVSNQILFTLFLMANRVSNNQLETQFLAEHAASALAKEVGLGARSKAVDKKWNDLATFLNAFDLGSRKSGERWKKYWADIKHNSKARLAKCRQEASGTGRRPSSQEELSETDRKFLAFIGDQAVFTNIEHRIPMFNSEIDVEAGNKSIPQKDQVVTDGKALSNV